MATFIHGCLILPEWINRFCPIWGGERPPAPRLVRLCTHEYVSMSFSPILFWELSLRLYVKMHMHK